MNRDEAAVKAGVAQTLGKISLAAARSVSHSVALFDEDGDLKTLVLNSLNRRRGGMYEQCLLLYELIGVYRCHDGESLHRVEEQMIQDCRYMGLLD